jgi:3-hydroxyisobutyrate dehydrogenase-like beta-hydroxyacid dehydrogenase
MATLGFVGLGAMGSRLARRLLAAGHRVVGYNRTAAKAAALAPEGLCPAPSPRAAAEASEVLFSIVTDGAALRAVAFGPDGVVAGLRPGQIWVEMSTVSPAVAREMGEAARTRGALVVDAPISGSTITVEQGQATTIVGGDPAAVERVRPYLGVLAPGGLTHVGELGQGVAMKIAINLGLAVQILAFSESVLLAEKSGIAREVAVTALLRSVVASPMLRYRGPFVLGRMAREAWFPVPMMQKDLQLALEQGRAVGAVLPTTALTQEWLTMARNLGWADHDFAAVFSALAVLSGCPPAPRPAEPPGG